MKLRNFIGETCELTRLNRGVQEQETVNIYLDGVEDNGILYHYQEEGKEAIPSYFIPWHEIVELFFKYDEE